jgi:hypothetical protein
MASTVLSSMQATKNNVCASTLQAAFEPRCYATIAFCCGATIAEKP